jgi:lipopolysaccharide assembly outer membrane protein LptD (OstA)
LLLCLFTTSFTQDTTAADTVKTTIQDTSSQSSVADSTVNDTTQDSVTTVSTKVKKDTVAYEADTIEYDIGNKIIFMHGNGIVRYHNMVLYADTIHFLFAQDMLCATGHPQLIDGNDTVVGDNMVYNLRTKRGKVKYGTAHSTDSKYNGNQIAITEDKSIYIENGAYSSCAKVDSAHYCFYGRHIKVIPNDKAISRPIILNVGDAPILAMPYFITPLDRGRQSGWLTPRWGGNFNRGGRLDNIGYYWALNDYSDLIMAGRVMEFQSYEARAKTNYKLRYFFDGHIDARYAIDNFADILRQRREMNYSHRQDILPDKSMQLVGNGRMVTDKNYYKDLSIDTTELLNQQQTNANLSLTKNFRKINANTSINWSRNQNFVTNTVTQELPSMAFTLSSRPLIPYKKEYGKAARADEENEKWYNKIRYSYSARGKQQLIQTDKDGANEATKHHAGISHSIPISASFKLFKWFTLTPSFSINQSFFDAYIDTNKTEKQVTLSLFDTVSVGEVPDTINPVDIDTIVDPYTNDSIAIYKSGDTTVIDSVYDTTYIADRGYDPTKAHSYWWETGASLSTRLYGLFPIKLFNFTGMRHTLTPSVGYRFIPKKDVEVNYPGIGIASAGRRLKRGQVISMNIGNLFEGRVKKRGKPGKEESKDKTFTMFTLNIGTSYDFEADLRKWSNITLSATIPNKLIDFTFGSAFTPYDETNNLIVPEPLNYSISLRPKLGGARGSFWGGDFLILEGIQPDDYMVGYGNLKNPGWSLSINPHYNFSRSRLSVSDDFTTKRDYRLNANASIKFSSIWSASWGSSYDFTNNRFMNHSVNFRCDLECWDLTFNWNPSGIDGGSFYFIVNIKKHPEIKWEHPENRRRFR